MKIQKINAFVRVNSENSVKTQKINAIGVKFRKLMLTRVQEINVYE